MIQQIKFSRINTDVDNQEIKTSEGEYLWMENLVPPKKGLGQGFVRESLKGTEEVTVTDPEYPSTRKVIGSFEDKPNGKSYFFVWTGDFNRIMEYDSKTKLCNRIIRSTQFQWTEDTRIVGIGVLDGVIYWADPNLNYYRLQDQSQFSEIDYNVRDIDSATTETFRFIAAHGISPDVNFQHDITGPLSATAVATNLAAAMLADASFSAYFTATLATGSTVIKITAINQTGTVRLTGTPDVYFNYYQTNFDREPETSDDFLLYPAPPAFRPLITPIIDTSIEINKIIDKNWQFAHRVIYLNNQISDLGGYSDIYPPPKYPEKITDPTIPNTLRLQLSVQRPEKVKTIEIAARTSEIGDWFVIKTLDRSEFFGSGGIFIYEFTGTEQQIAIATAESIKQQSGIPDESIELQILKNKIFAIDNKTGFDYEENDMSLVISILDEARVEGNRYLKEGGLMNVAMRFFDPLMKTDGTVHKVTQINIPERQSTSWFTNPGGSGKLPSVKQYLSAVPSGQPPIWARYFKFVRSDELRYGPFMQFHAAVHYYERPQIESDTPSSETTSYFMNGNKYKENSAITIQDDYRYLHLQLPSNLTIVPERGMIVHVLAGNQTGGPDQFTVLDVQGNMLVLEQPVNLLNFKYVVDELFIELYSPKQVAESNNFYEIEGTYDVIDPGLATRVFAAGPYRLNGDVFSITNEDEALNWKYDWDDYEKNGSTEAQQGLRKDKYTWGYSESYSKSFSATQLQDVEGETTRENLFTLSTEFTTDFGYLPDQALASRNLGRPAPLLQNVREESRPSTLRWSNDYIENAAINGLHTFEPLNEYPLPLERGPITKLQPAGEDVLLAIHSSGVTSMYIGKGIIRSADLNPTLITTEGVIGVDNELKHSYGCVHPTSVSEVDGNVYFWDGSRNEPVRYAQNGLTPLASTFMARVFFKETIPALFGKPDTYEVISGFDRLLNMIFFTFIKGSTVITLGFHEDQKAWIASLGFSPEYYGSVGDEFVGFVEGIPWLHNQDDVNHNTFYGTYYPSVIRIEANQQYAVEKAWDSIVVDSNKIWDVPSISNEEGQASDLVAADFEWRDNLYYADFLRDTNTPAPLLKVGQIAIRHGKMLSSQTLTVELQLNSSDYHFVRSIGIASTAKAGHYLQAEKK